MFMFCTHHSLKWWKIHDTTTCTIYQLILNLHMKAEAECINMEQSCTEGQMCVFFCSKTGPAHFLKLGDDNFTAILSSHGVFFAKVERMRLSTPILYLQTSSDGCALQGAAGVLHPSEYQIHSLPTPAGCTLYY